MKNKKAIVFLLLAIAALVTVDYFLFFGDDVRRTTGRTLLLDETSDIVRIGIRKKGEPESVLCREDRRWRLTAPYSGSIDERMIMRLVDTLSQATVMDAYSANDILKLNRTPADFSLDDPKVLVALTFASGASGVYGFGEATPTGDGVFASVRGTEAVFVVPREVFAAVNQPTEAFRRRTILPAGVESALSFEIKREGEPVRMFVKQGEIWRAGDREVSSQKVSRFISDLASANAVSFIWPTGASNETDHVSEALLAGWGLDPESSVTVVLNGVDGSSHRVSFGKEAADGLVYALVQNGSAVVTVSAAIKDDACQDADQFTDSRLFPDDIRSVGFFSVASDDGLYSLLNDKSTGWGLESPIAAPADRVAVEAMLSRILSLVSSDIVPSGGLVVSLSTNSPKVRVSRDRVMGKGSFEELRSREMLKIDPALVKRIVRSEKGGADETSVLYNRDRRIWSVEKGAEGFLVDEEGVRQVVSVLNPLLATRVEKLNVPAADLDDYGLDEPFLTIAIDQDSDTAVRRNILIGKKTSGGRFATIGSADAVFVLSEAIVQKLSARILRR